MNPATSINFWWAHRDFQRLVVPRLQALLGARGMCPSECSKSGLMRSLDQTSCIDWVMTERDGTNVGVSARVQRIPNGAKQYKTFTVRAKRRSGCETEFHKMRAAKANPGSFAPKYFVQAYVAADDSKLLLGAVSQWLKLYDFIVSHNPPLLTNPADGTQFYVLDWSEMRAVGIDVKEFGEKPAFRQLEMLMS